MNTFRHVLLLLLFTVLGCGQSLVDFPLIDPPVVVLTAPIDSATSVPIDTTVRAVFSKSMDPTTIDAKTFTLSQGKTLVPATVSYAGLTAMLAPKSPLPAGSAFTAMITSRAKDTEGASLETTYVWGFTTGDAADTNAPTVTFTDPADKAVAVALGTQIHAAFSEVMSAATLDATTFTVRQGNMVVLGSVTYAGLSAVFTPEGPLAASAVITATITTGAENLAGNALAADHEWSFTTGALPDVVSPFVTFTDPADGAADIGASVEIQAAFSETMDCATLNAATFTLAQGGAPIAGVVTCNGPNATFTPASALSASAVITATITTGAKDPAGNALAVNHVWSFTISALPDVAAPTVTFTDPADGAADIGASVEIQAAFSETMDCATLNAATFTLAQGAAPIAGVVTCNGPNATFTPAVALSASAVITATITTGAKDPAGNALAVKHVWSFTILALPDVMSPVVTFTDPADMATGVAASVKIQAAFNETMDCATLNAVTFTLVQGGAPVAGVVTCNGPNATFTPTNPLSSNPPTYTATITTAAKDLNGNGLLQDYIWTFETGPQPGLLPVALGAASSYAILAFNTVTNVNNPGTIVTGDLGISPGAALVGFPPGQVIGTIHAGDPIAAAAKGALLAAYNDAAGRLNPAVLPGDLSGLTFAPGLYNNSTSVMLSAGNFTLDAQGNGNAVFIFQMGSTLTTNAATQVILAGGAKATNIFWAVGTSATLGTNSIFKGTILAASAITMQTGAVLEGRLLAQGAAVTLDTNLITVPAP